MIERNNSVTNMLPRFRRTYRGGGIQQGTKTKNLQKVSNERGQGYVTHFYLHKRRHSR